MAEDVRGYLGERVRSGVLCVAVTRQLDVINHGTGSRGCRIVARQINVE